MEEDDPVTQDEYILRRILNRKDFIDLSLTYPVARAAVSPTESDDRGISVFRQEFVTAQQVAEAGNSESGYYIAKLLVSNLINIGLSVEPNPLEGELPGHALIPELGLISKSADKTRYKKLSLTFVRLITHRDIIYDPNNN